MTLVVSGCVTPKSYDYTNFRQNQPRSILVLPPLNESMSVEGTYGYLSTVTQPIAERGYYVFPIVVVDQFFKENGMPTAAEMHQVPLNKVAEIMGADAVLYVTLKEYGTKYLVLRSVTSVRAEARLVDTRTGIVLWEGQVNHVQDSGGSGSPLGDVINALIAQVLNTSADAAHTLSRDANALLFANKEQGLLYGPYHPEGAGASYRTANGTASAKASAPASQQSVPSTTPQSATVKAVAANESVPAQAATMPILPRIGDRWQYQLTDRGRVRGKVNIEIVDASGAKVKERITHDDYAAFVFEREIEPRFSPARFQQPVTLPGGYQLAEIAPYFPIGTALVVGKTWGPISGEFFIPLFGKRTLSMRVRVVGEEEVRVPAGAFRAWKVETEPATVGTGGQNAVVKCTFWYSAQSLRTVKMKLETVYAIQVNSSSETYELLHFAPAK